MSEPLAAVKDRDEAPSEDTHPVPGGWVGVDLDGTLAYYDGWRGIEHIGEPIDLMLGRVMTWLNAGVDVRIFTARVAEPNDEVEARTAIEAWCQKHLGRILPVTCSKDFGMVELWDDRCVRVATNTGMVSPGGEAT